MFLSDYHLHSSFSDDAKAGMLEMAQAEAEAGVSELCFTDHVEDCCAGDPISFRIGDFFAVKDAYIAEAARTREKLRGRIDVKLGAEISGINHAPTLAERLAATKGLDFIIGSVHNLRGMEDFYFMKYQDAAKCRELTRAYLLENIETVETGCCDVVGHIGYACNQMLEQGFEISVMEYPELLEELFRKAVQKGVGIEINTSGLRKKTGDTFPGLEAVKLYRELGGEIITVGSDGHWPPHAGFGLREGFEILREAGFRYVTVFNGRKPGFIKI